MANATKSGDQKLKHKAGAKRNGVDSSTDSWDGLLQSGAQFSNKYRVLALLGRGSYGEVYRVKHLILRRELALKVLRPELGIEAAMRQRGPHQRRIAPSGTTISADSSASPRT